MAKPGQVMADGNPLNETPSGEDEGWSWKPLKNGGLLTVKHDGASEIKIME